ncbi:MAG: hypothetical protein QNJ73_13745 [Gammaproteobacteria bacterium]|nr:hypothetical protein [Gammaproteobacteria bacterium]
MLALSPAPGMAVGIGDVKLNSRLGQPLRATVPVRLASGEALTTGCVKSTNQQGDLRSPRDVDVRTPAASGPGVYDLELSTVLPLYEPMYELSLRVDCGGMPGLVKHYVLMLDLPMTPATPVARQSQPSVTSESQSRRPVAAPARTTQPRQPVQRSRDPIAPGATYRVRAGDTLSTIAARIDGRPANFIWPMADLIFAANPGAFIRSNPDLIKLGAEIRIPAPSEWQADVSPATAALTPPEEPATAPPIASSDTAPPARLPIPPATETPALPTTAAAAGESMPAPTLAPPIDTPAATESPFADERLADTAPPPVVTETPAAPAAVVDRAPPPAIVITEGSAPRTVNPLLAILFGVLIGFGLSMLLLRGRLIEGLLGLLPGRRSQPARPEERTFDDTNDWLPQTDTEIGLAPIGPRADDTYVVEIDADETSETFDPVLGTPDEPAEPAEAAEPAEPVADPATATTKDVAALAASSLSDDDVMLTELFDDGLAELPAETDLPEEVFMADGEAAAGGEVAPTEEMPHFNDSTASMDVGPAAVDETEELAELGDDAAETANLTLDKLAELSAEDTQLSQTLREALSLLERDYDDELTASQVVDQSALKKAMGEHAMGESDEDTGTQTHPKLRKQG